MLSFIYIYEIINSDILLHLVGYFCMKGTNEPRVRWRHGNVLVPVMWMRAAIKHYIKADVRCKESEKGNCAAKYAHIGVPLHTILYIKLKWFLFVFVCLFVCTLYKSTFLNRSQPNFAHVSPFVLRRSWVMYGPTIFDPFRPLLSGASAEFRAQRGFRPKSHCDSVISMI
jgi:hypothetical protein